MCATGQHRRHTHPVTQRTQGQGPWLVTGYGYPRRREFTNLCTCSQQHLHTRNVSTDAGQVEGGAALASLCIHCHAMNFDEPREDVRVACCSCIVQGRPRLHIASMQPGGTVAQAVLQQDAAGSPQLLHPHRHRRQHMHWVVALADTSPSLGEP